MFSALHDHLASLDRHAQLTRCFSAVAEPELLVCVNFLIFVHLYKVVYCIYYFIQLLQYVFFELVQCVYEKSML